MRDEEYIRMRLNEGPEEARLPDRERSRLARTVAWFSVRRRRDARGT